MERVPGRMLTLCGNPKLTCLYGHCQSDGSYKSEHIRKYGGKYQMAGWQGYRYDLAMVFDPEFDTYVESTISPIAKYAMIKICLDILPTMNYPGKMMRWTGT